MCIPCSHTLPILKKHVIESALEDGPHSRPEPRKLVLLGPLYAGLGATMALYFAAAGVSILIEEWVLDGKTARFGLIAVLPAVAAVSIVRAFQFLIVLFS